ncbi:tetratricopeptide repeat protein [Planctomicrobium sp.]|nr:tetratricopeptide repeat protein [Planctomicrobium sp.]MDB4743148.1 tetratricopeptide repeat protein [Planctomicrobium sp.]
MKMNSFLSQLRNILRRNDARNVHTNEVILDASELNNPPKRSAVKVLTTSVLMSGILLSSGCGTSSMFTSSASTGDPVTRSQSPISNIMGSTERGLSNNSTSSAVQGGTDEDLKIARKQFQQAKNLYDDGKVADAEKAFKKLVVSRRERYESFGTKVRNFWGVADYKTQDIYNNFGDPVEEDALFMLAECQFKQMRFTKAQDSYDDLLNRYASTRHMDLVTKQLFRIARYWLGFPNEIEKERAKSDIQLASAETEKVNVSAGSDDSAWDIPLIPNLTDKTRPVYDADGRGLQALRSIWLHDATGPLADDALMLSANHNLRTRNFVEAKRLYELVREQYPDSPHLRDAFLLGSHVTLAAYEGPEYDGAALDKSRDLKQTMLQIFPKMSAEERKMLQQEIDQLHDGEIRRLWSQVEFYQKKNIPESVALHCNVIINRYPSSTYAEKSRAVLQEIQTEARNSGRPLWAWGNGQKPVPAKTAQAPNTNNQSDPRLKSDKRLTPQSSDNKVEEKSKRNIFGFLRKAEEPPQLQTPPANNEAPGRATL